MKRKTAVLSKWTVLIFFVMGCVRMKKKRAGRLDRLFGSVLEEVDQEVYQGYQSAEDYDDRFDFFKNFFYFLFHALVLSSLEKLFLHLPF